jgi:hypothetical protein
MVELDPSRIDRVRTEVEALRRQLAEIQIQRMQHEIATLRNQVAEVQSLRQAEAGVMEYLRNQSEAVDRDSIYGVRRGLLLKALSRLVRDGQVIRTGTGQRGDRYRYRVAGTPNGDERGNGVPNR